MTWGSCQISERSFGENIAMRLFQKPKDRPVTHCDEHANKADWKRVHGVTHQSSQCHQEEGRGVGEGGKDGGEKKFCCCCFLLFFVCLLPCSGFLFFKSFNWGAVGGGIERLGSEQNWGD